MRSVLLLRILILMNLKRRNSEGYLGYVPLDEMVWSTSIDDEILNDEDDGEFQIVRKPKGKKKPPNMGLGRGIVPPDAASGLNLSFIVYEPSVLATHLNLPVTLLPLLGALVGNDYSGQSPSSERSLQSLFFQRQLTLPQRINYVATTLDSILSASSQKRKQKHQVGSVMDLIDKAVDALLVRSRSAMGSGEVDNIITTIVEATLQYAIPKYEGEIQGQPGLWPTQVCALHEPDVCPLLPLFSRSLSYKELSDDGDDETEERAMREEVRALYVQAYRTGWLPPKTMHILSTGTSWPRIFLENPDLESVSRSVGRLIRQWEYAILEDGVGLPRRSDQNGEPGDEKDGPVVKESDDDELIDVVEEDSDAESLEDGTDGDPLEFLRGELERLRKPGDDGVSEPPKSLPFPRAPETPPPEIIVEYVRRGTRVTGEEVVVPLLTDLLSSLPTSDFTPRDRIPLQLRSEDDRLTVFLHALGSNTPSIKSLPPEQIMIALALRWVVRVFSDRAQSSGGIKDREKERWTKTEARAFLASFPWKVMSDQPTEGALFFPENLPSVVDRNAQLMAQVLMALESIADLSQVLLLSERVPNSSHLLSGKRFHSFLTNATAAAVIPNGLWEACVEGLEDAFGEEWRKKAKKGPKVKMAQPGHGSSQKSASAGGLFGLLGDMEA